MRHAVTGNVRLLDVPTAPFPRCAIASCGQEHFGKQRVRVSGHGKGDGEQIQSPILAGRMQNAAQLLELAVLRMLEYGEDKQYIFACRCRDVHTPACVQTMRADMRADMCACARMRMHARTCACRCVRIRAYKHTHPCIHACVRTCNAATLPAWRRPNLTGKFSRISGWHPLQCFQSWTRTGAQRAASRKATHRLRPLVVPQAGRRQTT